MIVSDPADLRREISALLEPQNKDSTLEAIRLSENFPPPTSERDDETAANVLQIAVSAEYFGENSAAASLYRRVLAYRVEDVNLTANAWYRLGVCLGRLGNWHEALACHRRALALVRDWPLLLGHARRDLADLLWAAEEYREAADLYRALIDAPAPEGIDTRPLPIKYARCLLRLGQTREAETELRNLLAKNDEGIDAVAARQLLAEIYQREGAAEAAIECYSRIAESRDAEPHVRAAALHSLAALRKSKRGRKA